MSRDFTSLWLAYLVAFGVALVTGYLVPTEDPIWIVFYADLTATLAIFVHSVAFRNSSFYDAYWSVVPPVIAVYWIASSETTGVPALRQVVVTALVFWWGGRLTWNWARSWGGLSHEDWRYVQIHEKTGWLYWPVSLAGIHLLPTLWVFLGCLPLYPALATGVRPWGALDWIATLVTVVAILCEQISDRQLHRFRQGKPDPQEILKTGLWSVSRHPNYFGEVSFWWGLYLFGLAADPSWWWAGIGAVAITVLFRAISLPLIETRMLERRPGYAEHQKRVSILVPWPSSAKSD